MRTRWRVREMGGPERGRSAARLGTTWALHAASGSGARKRWVRAPTLSEGWEVVGWVHFLAWERKRDAEGGALRAPFHIRPHAQ